MACLDLEFDSPSWRYWDSHYIDERLFDDRAEKGMERPVFTIKRGTAAPTGVWIESLDIPQGPVNQIPVSATAVIRSDSPQALQDFAQQAASLYQGHGFDDPAYRRAPLTVDTSGLADNRLVLTTQVSGAQHGSAPQENREAGANPLIFLVNFSDFHSSAAASPKPSGAPGFALPPRLAARQ